MKKFFKSPLWAAIKEPLRLLVLAIIPFLLAYFEAIPTEWAAGILLALRFVDKFMHELGKKAKSDLLEGGITRF